MHSSIGWKVGIEMYKIIIFALIVIVITPLMMIWSLNVLFPVLAIPYTLETWCACSVFSGLFLGKR